jgi:hypothetical protein
MVKELYFEHVILSSSSSSSCVVCVICFMAVVTAYKQQQKLNCNWSRSKRPERDWIFFVAISESADPSGREVLSRGSAATPLLALRVPIPPGGHGYLSLIHLVCCQVVVSASSWSLVRKSLTGRGVTERNREVSVLRRPWFTRGCCTMGK